MKVQSTSETLAPNKTEMLEDIGPMTYNYFGQTRKTMRLDETEIPLNHILLVMVITAIVVLAMQVLCCVKFWKNRKQIDTFSQ